MPIGGSGPAPSGGGGGDGGGPVENRHVEFTLSAGRQSTPAGLDTATPVGCCWFDPQAYEPISSGRIRQVYFEGVVEPTAGQACVVEVWDLLGTLLGNGVPLQVVGGSVGAGNARPTRISLAAGEDHPLLTNTAGVLLELRIRIDTATPGAFVTCHGAKLIVEWS